MDHQTLVFDGTLDPDAFLAFCAHRAQRLSIDHKVLERSPTRVEVTLRGHATLIDMFEMACSLGPEGSVVVATSRKAA
ncbi:MAG: hypothetical protein JJ908_00065 [Rhizobiales bacterium]|nr:hypothetical protein [Hyphomicrobiales bacterium]MBO6699009.1 hypothetical protein [Hyphomicrobiales bacterium]MBO6734738.1 hypothetical protein [Hyphomicrobiales bacterium]MBO6911456.1 hypothetical protein [Hyphomicrobiales bacterium]MBO6957036.1 hypothetical protein [Hyphomicrobiales bacterium]